MATQRKGKATRSSAEPYDVILFTDGACKGNPGPGGWAYILRHVKTGREKRESGGEPSTTNNRMELMAVIRGLEALKRPCAVKLVTDSQYVARGIREWLPNWKARGWKRKENGQLREVKNQDLWQRLDALLQKHRVDTEFVRGHRGHKENEECDRMAVEAAKKQQKVRAQARRTARR